MTNPYASMVRLGARIRAIALTISTGAAVAAVICLALALA